MNTFTFQIITTIIYALLIAISVVLTKSLVDTIFISIMGFLAILYIKDNQTVVKLIDKFL